VQDKSHVFLKVLDFGDDPSLVTSRIGLAPTSAWRLGDPMPPHPTATRNHSRWSFQSPLPLETHVEKHLETLLSLLEPQATSIRECAAEFSVELCCAIYYEDFTPGIHLSSEIVQRIAALGIPLDLDLYFLGEDSDAPKNV
jgi:Domain of unknown function (DUF4279)